MEQLNVDRYTSDAEQYALIRRAVSNTKTQRITPTTSDTQWMPEIPPAIIKKSFDDKAANTVRNVTLGLTRPVSDFSFCPLPGTHTVGTGSTAISFTKIHFSGKVSRSYPGRTANAKETRTAIGDVGHDGHTVSITCGVYGAE